MFDNLLESSAARGGRSKRTIAVSFAAHAVLLMAVIVAPLIYYQAIPGYELVTFLAPSPPPAPPAPPPPPSASADQPKQQVVRVDPDRWMEPQSIPKRIPPPMDDIPLLQDLNGKSAPPGDSHGQGLVSIPQPQGFSDIPRHPPPPEPKEPLRVGGIVQASRLVHRVEPEYPDLARRARVQGMVLLQVTVDERGLVSGVDVIRGHPLLTQAAVDAVSQWRYSPTLLNEEPVPVIATVTVNFVLR